MAYPPQQGQYGGYPRQQGPYGAPPQKNRAPLIATLIFVVALLAGLGITGFVAPGFFLSDDDSTSDRADGGGTGGGGVPAPGGGIEDGPADPTLEGGPGSGGADAPEPGDDSDDGPASGPGSGSGGATVDAGSAMTFAEEFVAALNAKDGDKANGMYCPDVAKGIVDYVVGKSPKLTLGTSLERGPLLEVLLKGTLDGNPLKRGKITVEMKNSNAPCVFTFSAG